MDGIFQVVRSFDDEDIVHVEGDVNPVRDMEIISNELRLKDIEWIEKALDNARKNARSAGNNSLEDRNKKESVAIIEKVLSFVKDDNMDVRKGDWNGKEVRCCRLQGAWDDKECTHSKDLTQLVEGARRPLRRPVTH